MDDVLNIAVCEDSPEEEKRLTSLLAAAPLPNRCTVFHSALDLLEIYRPLTYDLLLMDIFMDGMTGIHAVSQIRTVDPDVPVAFTTSSKDFALESYRLSALQYIEKPVQQADIDKVLWAAQAIREKARCLRVRQEGRETLVQLSRIVYLESQNRRLRIELLDGSSLLVYEKLSDLLPQLENSPFFLCHKSYCVNLTQVAAIDRELNCFKMSNGKNVPIRRALMGKAKQALQDHLFLLAKGGMM